MKTQLETVSSTKKKVSVEVPVERVAQALEAAYQKVQKEAELKGFRKGHVPRALLEQYYKDSVESEAAKELISATYPEAIQKEAALPISRPDVSAKAFSKDVPFSYTAVFEIMPDVEVSDYHGFPLEKAEEKISKEDVEHKLLDIQRSMTQLEPAAEDSVLGEGTVAFIDFKGTADGKPFKGSDANNFFVDVGNSSLLKDFEEKLFGMKKGEGREIEFNYPADYFNKELAGKKGVFDVKVRELKVKRVPELNDEFAKDLGKYKTIEEVKADIKKRLEEAVGYRAKEGLISQAVEHLVKKHEFEVPETMVAHELHVMFESFVRQLSAEGKKFENSGITVEKFIEQYKPVAVNRVRVQLILTAIAKKENISVDESEIEGRFETIAARANQPLDKVRERYKQKDMIESLKIQILHEKTLDFVVLKAKIKTKKAK